MERGLIWSLRALSGFAGFHRCTVGEHGGDIGSPVVYQGNRPWSPLSAKIVLDIGKVGKHGFAPTLCESISGQRQFALPFMNS